MRRAHARGLSIGLFTHLSPAVARSYLRFFDALCIRVAITREGPRKCKASLGYFRFVRFVYRSISRWKQSVGGER